MFGYGMQQQPSQPFGPMNTDTEPRYVPEDMELEVGDVVRHKVFGQGQVVDIDGTTISISFAGRGVKKLNVEFAPLERLLDI